MTTYLTEEHLEDTYHFQANILASKSKYCEHKKQKDELKHERIEKYLCRYSYLDMSSNSVKRRG